MLGRFSSSAVDPSPLCIIQPQIITQECHPETHKGARRHSGSIRMGSSPDSIYERGQWSNKAEFFLSCIGFSVGLGNIWRFPYVAFQNGGAAFVFAYLILQILIGKPMYLMELCLGQFSGKGPIKVWDMNPAAKGVGVTMCLICLTVSIYYNNIISYTIYYFFATMQDKLPWVTCTEEWKKKYNCIGDRKQMYSACTATSKTNCTCTGNDVIDKALGFTCSKQGITPAELFFFKEVIQKSDGLDIGQIGWPLWKLTICLMASWLIIAICLFKGIQSSGKVVYFSATFPYVILFVLFIRAVTLDGAIDGIKFFIIPKWEKLLDLHVWAAAMGQMFFSLSVGFGGILTFGSYNKFTNNVKWDAIIISLMDLLTSVIAGVVVFSTFGGMAYNLGTTVDKVAKGGYGLAFIAYPEALTYLPPTRLWSVLFFFMLFLLGLDSEFALIECFLTGVQDEFPRARKFKGHLSIGISIIGFLLSLPGTTPAGDYIVTLMDHFGGDFSVLFAALFEMISVMWVYGAFRFVKDLEYMVGYRPYMWQFWVFCWSIVSPLTIGILIIFKIASYRSLKYESGEDYPIQAQVIGWLILTFIVFPIPFCFFYRLYGSLFQPKGKRLHFLFKPTSEWVPNNNQAYLHTESNYHAKAEIETKKMVTKVEEKTEKKEEEEQTVKDTDSA